MSSFARNFGRIIATAIVVGANAAAETQGRHAANTAEQREADKWESRRQDAHAAIERALARHKSEWSDFRDRTKENKAIDLRAEADRNCRNRSEPLMQYTEECISRFEKNGY